MGKKAWESYRVHPKIAPRVREFLLNHYPTTKSELVLKEEQLEGDAFVTFHCHPNYVNMIHAFVRGFHAGEESVKPVEPVAENNYAG